MIKPISDWTSSYQSLLQQYYQRAASDPTEDSTAFWQTWMDQNTQGIETLPPYVDGMGSTTKSTFSPLSFTPTMLAPQSAQVLADCFQAYMMAITWTIPAVSAPFSVILEVVPSTLGVSAAYAVLLAGLTAEFLLLPPDPTTALQTKALAISTLFYTAVTTSGVELDGLATTGTPPPPTTVPFSPAG